MALLHTSFQTEPIYRCNNFAQFTVSPPEGTTSSDASPGTAFRAVPSLPGSVVRTTRLGIPKDRDGHLPYRFVDAAFARQATKNPFSSRPGRDGTARKAVPGEASELVVPSGGETVNWAKLLQR